MDLNQLKKHCDIFLVAMNLGYSGNKSGSCYQGTCPKHLSSGGKCLTIWFSSQSFHCFHCNAGSDVVDMVKLYKNCDFKDAVLFLAKYIGERHPKLKDQFADKQLVQCIEEMEERELVFNMLTEATDWFHARLAENPKVKSYLINHYGFSEKLINEHKIGYSPETKGNSKLAVYLKTFPEYKDHLVKTGVFNFSKPSGPYYDYFQSRIVFPYWKNKKVVYLAGRTLETI